ncbi:MAG: SDR family oxidoreductase [Gaiellales bacterium]
MIAVTGASGELGGRVASRLAVAGVAQQLVVRAASRAPTLDGAELAIASSYDDGEGMRAALTGCDTVFLVSAREDAQRVASHRSAIEAAVAAGVERIVYTSFLGATSFASFTFARDHFHTEQLIRATGLRFTFLRSSLYLDYLPLLVGEDGVIRGPAGDGRVAFVARDDIADVAAAVLLGDEHDGETLELTGREAVTLAEAATELTRAGGKTISYHPETIDEAYASRAPSGAPAFEIDGWVTSYTAIARGELDVVTDTVARVTGHEPISIPAFLGRH